MGTNTVYRKKTHKSRGKTGKNKKKGDLVQAAFCSVFHSGGGGEEGLGESGGAHLV